MGLVFWIAFVVYAAVTARRVYKERQLIISAVTILIMLAIVGWHIFSVPVSVELR